MRKVSQLHLVFYIKPSYPLTHLLAVVVPPWQFLGNVDLALSEIRSLKNEEDRAEALIRRKVIVRVVSAAARGSEPTMKHHFGRGFLSTNMLETNNISGTTYG